MVRLCGEGAECWGHFRATGVSYTLQLADLIVDVLSKGDILRPPREDSARAGGQDGGWGQSCQEAFPEFPGTGPRISAPIKTGSRMARTDTKELLDVAASSQKSYQQWYFGLIEMLVLPCAKGGQILT